MIKKRQIPWNKGKSLSKEHKQKIREGMKGKHIGKNNPFYGKKHSKETKQKISNGLKGENNPNWGKTGKDSPIYGRKLTIEEKEKRRQRVLGEKNPMYGKPSWSKGLTKEMHPSLKSTSEKLKGRKCTWGDKISKARQGKYSGKNHPNWRGGLKNNPYGLEFNEKLREQIRKRDKRRCVLCGGYDEDRKLQVHHVDYDKTNNDPKNLCSLCLSCHVKTNYNRDHWSVFIPSLIEF